MRVLQPWHPAPRSPRKPPRHPPRSEEPPGDQASQRDPQLPLSPGMCQLPWQPLLSLHCPALAANHPAMGESQISHIPKTDLTFFLLYSMRFSNAATTPPTYIPLLLVVFPTLSLSRSPPCQLPPRAAPLLAPAAAWAASKQWTEQPEPSSSHACSLHHP